MEYIIVYNPGQKNYFIHMSDHGFIETFGTFEDAEQCAKMNIDGDDIRSYEIYELTKG